MFAAKELVLVVVVLLSVSLLFATSGRPLSDEVKLAEDDQRRRLLGKSRGGMKSKSKKKGVDWSKSKKKAKSPAVTNNELQCPLVLPNPFEPFPVLSKSKERLQQIPAYPMKLEGAFDPDTKLHNAMRLFEGLVYGSESWLLLRSGQLAMLDRSGRIHTADPDPTAAGGFRYTTGPVTCDTDTQSTCVPRPYIGPGRPLGFHEHPHQANKLLVCDSLKGLVQVNLNGTQIELLSNRVTRSGVELNYVNDLDVSVDEQYVFFSSSTKGTASFLNKFGYYDTLRSYCLNFISGDETGRLLQYDMNSGETKARSLRGFRPHTMSSL